MKKFLFIFISTTLSAQINLTPDQARTLGNKIWYNECRNSIEKLTFWKKGEQWASLGIAHFIWYPAGKKGPYTEQFPELLQFLAAHEVQLPPWLTPTTPCPWPTQESFNKDLNTPRMRELRTLLEKTIDLQALFIAQRLEQALPKLLNACAKDRCTHVQQQFKRLAQTPQGLYALIDYASFKGDGSNPNERYANKGWGLLQILETMSKSKPGPHALQEFAAIAKQLLSQRVHNAPAERNENQWLKGWHNRVDTYLK